MYACLVGVSGQLLGDRLGIKSYVLILGQEQVLLVHYDLGFSICHQRIEVVHASVRLWHK